MNSIRTAVATNSVTSVTFIPIREIVANFDIRIRGTVHRGSRLKLDTV